MNQRTVSLNNSPLSYSQITQQVTMPTRKCAVVLDAIDGIAVSDYTRAIANKIDPANIRFVSRVSNSRVWLFFTNKDIADNLIDTHKSVTIKDHALTIRPLISRAKRIILSNAWPFIPNTAIQNELNKLGIAPVSQISYIKAGNSDPGLNHILSFRRQFYLNPEDVSKIPPFFTINFEDTDYYIYLSPDKVVCFACKEEGHLAKFCKHPDTLAQRLQEEKRFAESEPPSLSPTSSKNSPAPS